MQTIKVSQGLTAPFSLILNDATGSTFTQYTGTEALVGTVRTGTDRMILFLFTPTWVDPLLGKIAFLIDGADTQALPVGQYLLQISLADRSADLCEALLEIGYSPGVQSALPVYCSYQQVLTHAAWVDMLQNPLSDNAGFELQRAQARQDIDSAIIANYRGSSVGEFGSHSAAGMSWGGGGSWRSSQPSSILQGYLNSNYLMAGSDPSKLDYRPKVPLMAAYRSIAIIGLNQITINKEHVAAAGAFQRMFLEELISYTAELDTNQDGSGEIVIPMSSTNTLFT